MPTQKIALNAPSHYSLRHTIHAHGWYQLAPFRWDEKRGVLEFPLLLGKDVIDVSVRQTRKIEVALTSHRKLNAKTKAAALACVRRSLDLDADTRELLEAARAAGENYAQMVRNGAGRRHRGATLWEDAAKTLFTTNCTWGLTKKMAEAACTERFAAKSPAGYVPFPASESLAAHNAAALKELLPVGYRAGFLSALARTFAADPLLQKLESPDTEHDAAYAAVNALDGFGPYATGHLLMMAGHFHHIPIDTVATSFVREAFGARKAESFIQRRYAKWGRFRFWGFRLDQIVHWGGGV
jgi:3-methyladenine DNA glycosylase/8-oxoguanine DNA glycosylase